jgi:hypothetical protein
MRDLKNSTAAVLALSAVVHTATKTDAPIVDLQGAGSVLVTVVTGAIASAGDYTITLRHSDNSDMSSDALASGDDLLGTFPASLAADSVYTVGYKGEKRYARVVITKNGGTSIAAGAAIIKGHLALTGTV